MQHKAHVGTVSHGTMQPTDLISAFSSELEHLAGEATPLVQEANAWLESDDDSERSAEQGGHILEELFEALDALAPPYCYFGAHEGDGADYGFWPSMDQIEELPKFADLADVPEGIEDDYAIVNDHGNVSVYSASGEEIVAFV